MDDQQGKKKRNSNQGMILLNMPFFPFSFGDCPKHTHLTKRQSYHFLPNFLVLYLRLALDTARFPWLAFLPRRALRFRHSNPTNPPPSCSGAGWSGDGSLICL